MDINSIITSFKTFPKGLSIIALINKINKKVIIVQTRNMSNLVSRILDSYYRLLDYNITDVVFLETKLEGFDKKSITPLIKYYLDKYEEEGYTVSWKDSRLAKVRCVVRYFPTGNTFRVMLISANGTKEVVGVFKDVIEAYEWAREYYHVSKNPYKFRVMANNLSTKQSVARSSRNTYKR